MEKKSLDVQFLEHLTPEQILCVYKKMLIRKINTSGTKVVLSSGSDQITDKKFSMRFQEEMKYIQKHCKGDSYHFRPFREVNVLKERNKQKNLEDTSNKTCLSVKNDGISDLPPQDTEKKGNYRVLSIACIRDTLVQNLMMDVLSPHLESESFSTIDKNSYAYRKGHSTTQAIYQMKHCINQGYTYVLSGDIEGFFDNINHKLLKLKMKRTFCGDENPILYHLLKSFLAAPRVTEENFLKYTETHPKNGKLPVEGRKKGIPQGGVLSGMLANLFMYDFDCHVLKLSKQHDFMYLRYADDFILMFRNSNQVQEVFQSLVDFLHKEKLTLHPLDSKKTVIRDLSSVKKESIDFVGFEVNPRFIRMKKKNERNFIATLVRKIKSIQIPPPEKEDTSTFQTNKNNYFLRIKNLMKTEILGEEMEGTSHGICKQCSGVVIAHNVINYYLAMDDPRQYAKMDRILLKHVQKNYFIKTGEYLSKAQLQSIPSLEKYYYHYKKERNALASGTLKHCDCQWEVDMSDNHISRRTKPSS